MKVFTKTILVLTLLTLPAVAADIPDVFEAVDASVAVSDIPMMAEQFPETVDILRLRSDVLMAGRGDQMLRFTLPAVNRQFFAERRMAYEDFSGTFTWVGQLKDADGSVAISVKDGVAYGLIETADAAYRIEPTEVRGVHWVYRLDERAVAAICSTALVPNTMKNAQPGGAEPTPAAKEQVVDLLVVYTKGFADEYPDDELLAQINFLIAVSNTALTNSEINMRIRLVGTMEVDYPDGGSLMTALEDISPGNDRSVSSEFSSIESERTKLGADQVTLLRVFKEDNGGVCGLAWIMTSLAGFFSGYEYSVVQVGRVDKGGGFFTFCADQTLVHELGHNWGSNHNSGDSPTLFSYSLGHRYKPGSHMTVMSYSAAGERTHSYFSNPDVKHEGSETGTESLNNARSINMAAKTIASWKPTKISEDSKAPKNKTKKSRFLNKGDSTTTSREIKCKIVGKDNVGITAYHISENKKDPSLDDDGWVFLGDVKKKFKGSVKFTLSEGKGKKKVFVRFRDAAGNISKKKRSKITLE